MPDNTKLQVGSGQDLQIYHIANTANVISGAGPLTIQSDDTTSGVSIQTATGGETMAKFIKNGAVELYHDNSKKFETTSYGALVTGTMSAGSGNFDVADNGKFKAGNSSDLQIYHDGTASFITNTTGGLNLNDTGGYFRVKSDDIKLEAANGEDFLECDANGAVSLYYDNSKKFETDPNGFYSTNYGDYIGVTSNGQTASGRFGYHDNFKLYIENVRGTHTKVIWDNDGKIRSQISDGSNLQDRFEVNASGAILSGNFLPDANDTRNLGNNATRWDGIYGTYVSAKHSVANTATNAEFRNEHSVYGGGVRFKSNNTYGTLELTNYSGSAAATLVNTTGGWHWSHNLILGQNIAFNGETANANELDDYEEGTFTPILRAHSNTTGQVSGSGRYTKVGNIVHCNIDFENVNASGIPNATTTEVTGLPFTVLNANDNATATTLMTYGVYNANRTNPTFYASGNTSSLFSIYSVSGGAWAHWPTNDINQSGIYLNFSIRYFTAT